MLISFPRISATYMTDWIIIIGYCINTTLYDRGHVSDALPSLRGNALPRHERGHKMLYLYNNLIIVIIVSIIFM